MIKIFAFLVLLTCSALAADPEYHPPLDILKKDGELALFDTASYFVFSQDGTFRSFPVGMSGRMLTGKWTAKETNPIFMTVIVKGTPKNLSHYLIDISVIKSILNTWA